MTGKNKIASAVLAAVILCVWGQTAPARPLAGPPPVPMRRATNEPAWHSLHIAPDAGLKIRWQDKLNPVWWLKNADDPVPPDWYLPGEKHRALKWSFRNPLHNFNFYVIGLADKQIIRSGRWPKKNFNPAGGWELAVVRRNMLVLPFISYRRTHCIFYLGWRERGEFGAELKFPRTHQPG